MKKINYLGMMVLSFSVCADSDNSWNGCYLGAHGGSANVDNHFVATFFAEEPLNKDIGSVDDSSGIYGLQAGCRMQLSNSDWVLGFKVSGSEGDTNAKHLYIEGTSENNYVSYQSENLATISAQLGFLLSDVSLLYMNLGYGQVQMLVQDTDPTYYRGPIFFQNKRTLEDVLVGVGYEHRLSDHWSVFAEYNRIDFGKDRDVPLHDLSNFWDINDYTADISHDMDFFQLGVNFSF
ncbi:MAG: outer membrane beta-barrel protein [Marinicella sp.]|nr:outer membrane beta-barrel protein [Xanthomonadales bacterium]